MNARKKITAALVYGIGLRIEEAVLPCEEEMAGRTWKGRPRSMICQLMERELALLRSRLEHLESKLAGLKGSEKTNSSSRRSNILIS